VRKNRFLVLSFRFCHSSTTCLLLSREKNIFDIFPSLPKLDLRERREIYIPANDGKSLLKESRKMEVPEEKERFVALIFRMVSKGSIYENTSGAVPVDTQVRTIWLKGDTCSSTPVSPC
jgi:SHS2 domain-containing protein